MSSEDKDPLEKQDTPSESSESHSDSEENKAEENLEHLKIEEHPVKEELREDSEESKPLDSPTQEGTLTSENDHQNESTLEPNQIQKFGLVQPQTFGLASSDSSSDPEMKDVSKKEKVGKENIGVPKVLVDSDTTGSMPMYSSSSPSATSSKNKTPTARGQRHRQHPNTGIGKPKPCWRHDMRSYFPYLQPSSSSRHVNYATDSANTSSDFPEITSEIEDSEAGSVYYDAPDDFEEDQSQSYKSAVERISLDSSDANISDIPDENSSISPPSLSLSASISTPSGEGGHRGYIEQLQREADERGEQPSTSSGIGSTNQSEFVNLERWGIAGELGFQRRDMHNRDIPENEAQSREPQDSYEPEDDQPIPEYQMMQDFERLFQRNEENSENSNLEYRSSRMQEVEEQEKCSNVGVEQAFTRRRQLKYSSDSSSVGKGALVQSGSRILPQFVKKSKTVPSKLNDPMRCGSESPEPKSTSSDESHHRESPEMKSSSESSRDETGRKSWQKSGILRSMQLSNISSKDSVIAEEEEGPIPSSIDQSLELMKSKNESEKMDENTKDTAANAELSESKPSTLKSSDQVCISEGQDKIEEQEPSFEVQDLNLKVAKSKQKLGSSAKLSNLPEELGTSVPPVEISKSKKQPEQKRRTRNDSNSSLPKSIAPNYLKEDESSSSEQSDSPDEKSD